MLSNWSWNHIRYGWHQRDAANSTIAHSSCNRPQMSLFQTLRLHWLHTQYCLHPLLLLAVEWLQPMGSYFPHRGAFDCKAVSFVISIPIEFKTVTGFQNWKVGICNLSALNATHLLVQKNWLVHTIPQSLWMPLSLVTSLHWLEMWKWKWRTVLPKGHWFNCALQLVCT